MVVTDRLNVDGRFLTSLAYHVWENGDLRCDTVLCIHPLSQKDIPTLNAVFLSFFYEENILFGKKIWSSPEAAVFFRSEHPKPDNYPSTYDHNGKGLHFEIKIPNDETPAAMAEAKHLNCDFVKMRGAG